jgi:hypothetical protein
MQLEDEQYEMLGKFVEAHLSTPREKRGTFNASRVRGELKTSFVHSEDSRLSFQGSMSDAEILAHAGLLLKSTGSRENVSFLLLPQGIEAHKKRNSSPAHPKVFISYSHDSPEHLKKVREFADRLRTSGIDAILDQYELEAPPEGWPIWFQRQMQNADAVLLVCSRGFGKSITEGSGLGVRWEGSMIYQELYNDNLATARFVPVVFEKSDIKFIPEFLRAFSLYLLDTEVGFESLYRRLTRQPTVIRPALGAIRAISSPMVRNLYGILIFLCHCSEDKPAVRDLYRRLSSDGAKPWLDEEDLLAGQSWQEEIPKAVREADAVVVCLSPAATDRAGYFHKEIKFALDVLDLQPEGSIYLIPVKITECSIPERLSHLHCISLEEDRGYEKLKKSLLARAKQLRFDAVP